MMLAAECRSPKDARSTCRCGEPMKTSRTVIYGEKSPLPAGAGQSHFNLEDGKMQQSNGTFGSHEDGEWELMQPVLGSPRTNRHSYARRPRL
jgi:hypothetical protein